MGLTQAAFGSRLGVTHVTINRWETGSFVPDNRALAAARQLAPKQDTTARPSRGLELTADPNAAVAGAVHLSFGHLAGPTFAAEVPLIGPLPHQRMAVYETSTSCRTGPCASCSPRTRAPATIMTGFTVREPRSRRLARRVLVVAPAGLLGN